MHNNCKILQDPFVGRQVEDLAREAVDVDGEGEHEDQLHDEDEEHGKEGGDHEAGGRGGEGGLGGEGDGGCEQLGVRLRLLLHNDGDHDD